jgi:hypothetical protein
MKNNHRSYSIIVWALFLSANLCPGETGIVSQYDLSIPVAGNTWVANSSNTRNRIISRTGIQNWSRPETILRTFFRVEGNGDINIGLRARVRSGASTLKCVFGQENKSVKLDNHEYETIAIGSFTIKERGYQHLDLQGLKKSGADFAEVTDILIGGAATKGKVYFVKEDFYFGKRGPSVHLGYSKPAQVKEIKYFYNEITVPKGEDVVGSFFMANGFRHGYFGIQVNSPDERRILFSVWSPYRTNNPREIPADQRVQLIKKGSSTYAGKFGGEGSGGQSYRKYMWRSEVTYKFLLKGEPVANNYTEYTAYFFAPEIGVWELIASFRRPKTNSYLSGLHSFLENFIPATGQYSRKGFYANQWVCDKEGNWFEMTQARFTADATARKESRLDYTGGAVGSKFYLKNCGFFNERSEIGAVFTRQTANRKPAVDLTNLP